MSEGAGHVLKDLKDLFLIRPAHPRPWAGIRVAVSVVVPLVVVYSLFLAGVIPQGVGLPTLANTWFNIATWIVVGSLLTCLVVNDGTGQDQVIRFSTAAVFVLLGVGVGSVASTNLAATLVVAFLWGILSSFVGLLRSSDGLLHLAVTVPIVIGFSLPTTDPANYFFAGEGPASVTWARLAWMVVGIAWAALVAVATRSLQRGPDAATESVRTYLKDVVAAWNALADDDYLADRTTTIAYGPVERAYDSGSVAAEAVGSLALFGNSGRRRRLALAYSNGERVVRVATGVGPLLRHLQRSRPDAVAAIRPALLACGQGLETVTRRLTAGDPSRAADVNAAIDQVGAALRDLEPRLSTQDQELAQGVVANLRLIATTIATLESLEAGGDMPVYATTEDIGQGPGFWDRVRAEFRLSSDTMHHGIRIGAALVIMVLVYTYLPVPLPFFMALAIVATVQPDVGTSITSALRIGTCTVIGSLVAGLVIVAFPNVWAVMIALAIFAFLGFTFSDYAPVILFSLMTPIFILLFTFNALGDWQFALDRVIDTVIGVAIGLVCCLIFWPRTTANRWHGLYENALRSIGDSAAAILQAYGQPRTDEREDQVRSTIVAALRAQRALRGETRQLTSQPKTLQTVAPLALGAEQGIAVAMGALHVAASDLSTSSQQPTDHIGQEIQRRYTELADAVAGWHSVIDPTAAFTDLVGRAADTDQTLVSAPVDRAVTFLGRTAEQSAQMINDAVALAPDGPMTLRNRSLRPAAA
ncbi:MAG: FUSC family protein [Actinobacteria bacterium]|nr:FUSC family protein [Actinomycetota bacterium]